MTDATLERPRPRIDHPDELDRMVHEIVEKVAPLVIYLFGSRARGDADAESDYDLMIVVPDDAPDGLRRVVWDLARPSRIAVNPFLSRERSFAWRRHEVGTLEYEVAVDGIQLYPRQRWRPPSVERPGSMNTTVVEEWLRRVEEDLIMARKGCEGDDAVPGQSAYHLQQAAEKLTKAALVAHGRRPRKGHRIQEFTPRLPDAFPLKDRFRALERFSDFVWIWRYPEEPGQPPPPPEPSVAEARAWLAEVRVLKTDLERWLEQRAGRTGGDR
jgi:predicted nucleotidyltransferase/HEPN domain-containing protein